MSISNAMATMCVCINMLIMSINNVNNNNNNND